LDRQAIVTFKTFTGIISNPHRNAKRLRLVFDPAALRRRRGYELALAVVAAGRQTAEFSNEITDAALCRGAATPVLERFPWD
jgi:hypothetical protein